MKKCELYMMEDFLGMIVPCRSRVIWSNQAGGILCVHPQEQGVFIPLMKSWDPPGELEESWPWWSTQRESRSLHDIYLPDATILLKSLPDALHPWFRPLTEPELMGREIPEEFGEAWWPVWLEDMSATRAGLLPDALVAAHGFGGRLVILTHENSD